MEKIGLKKRIARLCRGKLSYILLGGAILLTAALGFTVAKYVQTKNVEPKEADAARFYFASDILEEEISESIKTYYLSFENLEDAKIKFKLYNFQDELNWSEANITYDIECQVDADAKKTVRSDQVLTFNKNAKTETEITLSAQDMGTLSGGSEVTVWARAKEPYSAILVAKFVITKPETQPTITVRDSEGSNVVQVMMEPFFTDGSGNNYRFTYPGKAKNPSRYCIVDMADERLTDNKDGTVSFKAYGGNAFTFVFYKADPAQLFTGNDFQLVTQ